MNKYWSFLPQLEPPKFAMSVTLLIRLLLGLCIVLSLLAGYYHASLGTQQKKYARLEDMYVRVRNELGREETQRLIDQSKQKEMRGEK